MEKNTVLAFVLSGLVLIGWFYFMAPPPQPQETVIGEDAPIEKTVTETEKSDSDSVKEPVDEALASDSTVSPLIEEALEEEFISFKTDIYDITLSSKGARITSFKYGERNIELALPFENNPEGFDYNFYFKEKNFSSDKESANIIWKVHEKSDNSVTFAKNEIVSGKTIVVYKKYDFSDGHSFSLSYQFYNPEETSVYLPEEGIIFSSADFLGPKMDDYTNSFNLLKSFYYSDKKRSLSKGAGFLGGLFSEPVDIKRVDEKIKWSAIVSRYFVSVMYSDKEAADGLFFDSRNLTSHKAGQFFKKESLKPGANEYKFNVVVSEKNKAVLKDINPILEDASDTSKWIDPIRMVVVWALKKINGVVPNFGWSIVIFSILSKLILLPLTHKSTQSMKKMSELQPEIKKLKEKYKDNPQESQKKMMELYKQKGVNPMGGCLPMLVQMPFFIALYSALSNSVDMWNSPFIFWIKDLSSPETLFTIAGLDIHVLPLIMTAASFLQQKVSATDTGAAGQQQMVMKMMPVILLFVFWRMPSGLIIYWTIQNIIQVIHQVIVNHKSVKQS